MDIGFVFLFPIEKLTYVAVLRGPNAVISRELKITIFGRHLPKALPWPPFKGQAMDARFHHCRISGYPIKGRL